VESIKQEQHATQLARGGLLDRFFKLTEHRTTIKTELLAGLTTFVTMAYIIFDHRLPIERLRLPKAHRG